jgi:hypothetical protein
MTGDDIVSRAEELVEKAEGETVEVSKLINGENSSWKISRLNEPLISYLLEGEQPHHIHQALSVKINGSETVETSCGPTEGLMVFSNMRILVALCQDMTDDLISIPLGSIDSVNYEKPGIIRKGKFVIRTKNREYIIKMYKKLSGESLSFISNTEGTNQSKIKEDYQIGPPETDLICRKCKEKVSPEARKCPHCGYYPGKGGKGALWHGTALATSFSPVGWAMMAKGAADGARTRRGIAEEVKAEDASKDNQARRKDSFEKIERLNELKEQGALSEEEFQQKKEEILEEI